MRIRFRRIQKALRRLTAGNRKSRFRREVVLFFAPVGLAGMLLLIATQNSELLAAVWNDPQSLLAKRSPGERDQGALYDTKPERVADADQAADTILPKERVLAITRERPTLPLPADVAPEELPIGLADLGDFAPSAVGPAAFTSPGFGFAAPGGGGPGGGSSAFAPSGPIVPADDEATLPDTVPGPEDTTPSDLPSGPTPPTGPDAPVGSPVPEPETWATMILGLFVVAGSMRRRNRRDRHPALPAAA